MSSELPRVPRDPKAELAAIHARRPPSFAVRHAADAAAEAPWCLEILSADRLRDRLRGRLVGRERKRLATLIVGNVDRLSRRSLMEILGLLDAPDPKNRLVRRTTHRG